MDNNSLNNTEQSENPLHGNLTKKERKALKREEKENKRVSELKRQKTKKALTWGMGSLVVVGVITGLIFSGGGADPGSGVAVVSGVNDSDWVKGNKDAQVTLIEYGDFQCPACASYYPVINSIADELGEDIKIVYRHFPLRQIHRNANIAAQAAEAAGKQGKFWEMHDLLYENQDSWKDARRPKDVFVRYAEDIGLETQKFEKDIDSEEVKDAVDDNYDSGSLAGVSGTPTIFLNETKLRPKNFEEFRNTIIEAINEAKSQ